MLKEKIENRIKEKIKTELSYEEEIGGRYVLEWVLEELNKMTCENCKYYYLDINNNERNYLGSLNKKFCPCELEEKIAAIDDCTSINFREDFYCKYWEQK